MNVSMQDGFNLAWKLGQVLEGRSPESLLDTYSAERQEIAQHLIDFDKEWAEMMTKTSEELDPAELGAFYVATAEFPAGFMTRYKPSMLTGEATYQDLATGFPIGKRFKSAPVVRVADANPMHLGHHHRADGRWRVYGFAPAETGGGPVVRNWAEWMTTSSTSPLPRFTPEGGELASVFDIKVVFQQTHDLVDLTEVPKLFLPRTGPFDLVDYEKVYAVDPRQNIFDLRGIDRDQGAVVVVRPDQYVAHVLPFPATEELAAFFARSMLPAMAHSHV